MRSLVAAVALAACVPPSADPPPNEPFGEVAVLRIARGDTLSEIADRLSFPGGWRALATANGIRGDFIRATAGLRVPIDYLRRGGVDPYAAFGLEPLPARAQPRSLVPCAAEVVRGECIARGDDRVCVERTPAIDPDSDATDVDDDGNVYALGRDGIEIARYRGGERRAVAIPNGFVPEGEFVALRADLDGDGRVELVVAHPLHLWNHLGIESSRVFVIGDAGMAQLDVDEWGDGSLIARDDGSGCALLATSWESPRHPLDAEGGMYLVGRLLRYDRGQLVADGAEVVRRMRTYFHGLGENERPAPAAWLSAPEAEWWPELPVDMKACERRGGAIASAHDTSHGVELDVVFDDGERMMLSRHVDDFAWRERRSAELTWLVDATTGMRFPEHYAPADPLAWRGARVDVDAECCAHELAENGTCFEREHVVSLHREP